MNQLELIKLDLGVAEWETACKSWREPIQQVDELNPFARHKIFIVRGGTGQFDFRTLPHGSYTHYASNGRMATRLTRENKQLESILRDEWEYLRQADPVKLASLVLKIFADGIRDCHHVLRDADSLRALCNSPDSAGHREWNEKEFAVALPRIGVTQTQLAGELLSVRAVTLKGWMHTKQDLGIETFSIPRSGSVSLSERLVLSPKIFSRVPTIHY